MALLLAEQSQPLIRAPIAAGDATESEPCHHHQEHPAQSAAAFPPTPLPGFGFQIQALDSSPRQLRAAQQTRRSSDSGGCSAAFSPLLSLTAEEQQQQQQQRWQWRHSGGCVLANCGARECTCGSPPPPPMTLAQLQPPSRGQTVQTLAARVHSPLLLQTPAQPPAANPQRTTYLGMSFVTCLFFNFILGGVAVLLSVRSHRLLSDCSAAASAAGASRQRRKAQQLGRCACYLNLLGITVSMAAVIAFFQTYLYPDQAWNRHR